MQFAFRAAENVGAAKGPHMMGWWGIHDCRCIIRAQVSELPGLLWIAEPLLHQLCCEFLHYNYLVVLLGRLSHCFPSNVIAAAALVCGGLFTSSFSYFFLMSKWYGRVPGKLVLILPLDVAGTCRGIDSHSPPPPPPITSFSSGVNVSALDFRWARFNEWRLQGPCIGSDLCVMIFKQVIYWLKSWVFGFSFSFGWLYLLFSANNWIIKASNADKPVPRE